MISRLSKKKEATYDFLAFMANRKNAFFNAAIGWTGVQPGMQYEYFPPVGSGSVVEWENQGWDKADAITYLNAYHENLVLPVQQIIDLAKDMQVVIVSDREPWTQRTNQK